MDVGVVWEEGGKTGEEECGGVCGSSFDAGYRTEGEDKFWSKDSEEILDSSSFSFNSKSNDIAMGPELGASSCACSTMLMRRFRRSARCCCVSPPPPNMGDVCSSLSTCA